MNLHYHLSKASSSSPWLVLIHGLFGSADNLSVVKRHFEKTFNIISVDLPDHGQSPWCENFNIVNAADDVLSLLSSLNVQRAAFLGHSLGGKVAMQVALRKPESVAALIVADIAPSVYTHRHQSIFDGLNAVNLEIIQSRGDADKAMSKYINEPGVRQFLLKSLYKNENDHWAWRFNLAGLISSYSHIIDWPQDNRQFSGLTLFIKGSESDYITGKNRDDIARHFPYAKAHIIDGAGHWLHAEKTAVFNAVVSRTLDKIERL